MTDIRKERRANPPQKAVPVAMDNVLGQADAHDFAGNELDRLFAMISKAKDDNEIAHSKRLAQIKLLEHCYHDFCLQDGARSPYWDLFNAFGYGLDLLKECDLQQFEELHALFQKMEAIHENGLDELIEIMKREAAENK